MIRIRHAWLFAVLLGCGSEHTSIQTDETEPSLTPVPEVAAIPTVPEVTSAEVESIELYPVEPVAAELSEAEPVAAESTVDLDASVGPPLPPFDPMAEARARQEAAQAAFEREWPLHGVAFHFLAQIHAEPDVRSRVIGYIRRGSRFRAKDRQGGPGCRRGWHAIVGGGFVCRGGGFLIGRDPQTFEPSPAPPALEDALPYPYAYVARENAAQFWRIPTEVEADETLALITALREERDAETEASEAQDANSDTDGPEPASPDEVDDEAPTPSPENPPGESAEEGDEAAESGSPYPEFVRMPMRRGFYVSVDREEKEGDRRFFRTVRGGYVDASILADATPPEMSGVVLGGAWTTPMGFVHRRGVRFLNRNPVSGVLSLGEQAVYHLPLPLETEIIERRGSRYRIGRDGSILRESAMRVVEPIARPEGVAEDERWIHVDLSSQTLVAYVGDHAIFATLTSTGRAGHETPIGTYRIASKHVSSTMDDLESAEPYSIEDVPWTMFFEGSYALHGAFWHDAFGQVRSHGCVNLAPADARWLFFWSDPPLPPGWHGVSSTSERPGTVVHITE